jgi:hypothetical protein
MFKGLTGEVFHGMSSASCHGGDSSVMGQTERHFPGRISRTEKKSKLTSWCVVCSKLYKACCMLQAQQQKLSYTKSNFSSE